MLGWAPLQGLGYTIRRGTHSFTRTGIGHPSMSAIGFISHHAHVSWIVSVPDATTIWTSALSAKRPMCRCNQS